MNNFEARYSVIGTSALKAPASESQDHAAIIEFPAPCKPHGVHHAAHARQGNRLSDARPMREVRLGTVQGKAFDRIAPWQSVTAGIVLAAAGLATIFLGI